MSEIETMIRAIVREEISKLNPTSTMTPADLRLKAGLTAEQLAKAAGINVDQVYRYERGDLSTVDDRRVIRRMNAIAAALNIDVVTYRQSVRTQMKK